MNCLSNNRFRWGLCVALLCLFGGARLWAEGQASPLSPAAALETIQVDPALVVELAASEPQVQDPVAICWDAAGAMYVAEMGDYPALPTGGRIKRLVDRDGDGVYETATVFAAEIAFPNGVLPHRDGLLVTAAPDILFLKDTDGDGIADLKQRVLTGFGQGNQQLRVNSLIRGLDGWIYGANGRSDGEIGFVGEDGQIAGTPLSIRGTDFRFDPDRKLVETAGGFTQFGQSFDDYGNRFISWNTVHIRHVVMEPRYLIRNPKAAITATTQEISDGGSTPRLFPISQTTKRFNTEIPGFFNASCGLTIFRGTALGPDYKGNAFCCEPLSNIVHRDVLKPSGATFIASRAANEQDREFLASTDTWFRPVNLATGPDGALYVVDFYRKWVEHPQWVANEEARKNTDWDAGKEFGRIWRVRAKGEAGAKPVINLAALSNHDLLPLLGHPNAWQRETASRLLVERGTKETAPIMQEGIAKHSEEGRIQTLGTLAAMRGLTSDLLVTALQDRSSRVRRLAVQLSESQFASRKDLVSRVAGQWESPDEDLSLRVQVASSLAFANTSPDVMYALTNAFIRDGKDPWMQQALFSACGGRVRDFMRGLYHKTDPVRDLNTDQLQWLIHLIQTDNAGIDASWFVGLLEIGDGPRLPKDTAFMWRGILSLGSGRLLFKPEEIPQTAVDSGLPLNQRLIATAQLRFLPPTESLPVLPRLFQFEQPLDLQQWAVEAAFAMPGPEAADMLCESYTLMTPSVQRAVLDHLISHKDRVGRLALAIESQQIPATHLDIPQRELLASRLDEPTREKLAKLWAPVSLEAKDDLIRRYAVSLSSAHDVAAGKQLFQQHCRTCHQRQGDGNRVGPDLTGVAGRSPTDILADVLDPNRSVSVDGRSYTLVTKDGVVTVGVLAGETATSISLKKPGGAVESVLRSEIEELKFTGKSLMPEGFDRLMKPEELASLIAFLKDANAK